jgi:hypothetical protein
MLSIDVACTYLFSIVDQHDFSELQSLKALYVCKEMKHWCQAVGAGMPGTNVHNAQQMFTQKFWISSLVYI